MSDSTDRRTAITGSISLRIGEQDPVVCAEFKVPVVAHYALATPTVRFEIGNPRDEIVKALREAADKLEREGETCQHPTCSAS